MDVQNYLDRWNTLDNYLRNNPPNERDYAVIINHLMALIHNLNDRLVKVER